MRFGRFVTALLIPVYVIGAPIVLLFYGFITEGPEAVKHLGEALHWVVYGEEP